LPASPWPVVRPILALTSCTTTISGHTTGISQHSP
jgi:hypothetical protein